MDEPKRRARRAQQAQPDTQTPEMLSQTVQDTPPPRRRRAQQTRIEPPQTAQTARSAQTKVLRNKLPAKTKTKKKGVRPGRSVMQAALGAAVLLGMAGTAFLNAAKRIQREHLRLAAMALCICVALVSAWQVGSIVLRSVRTNRLNASLSQQRAAMIEAQQEAAFDVPAADVLQKAEPEQTPAPERAMEAAPVQPAATRVPDVVKMTKYHQVGGEALPEMAQLHQLNHDLVAWIQIPEVLDLPVVYRDNDYYLTRDFDKQKNASGTIFLDENHPFREKTQNLLLHGHNMKDGTMFGRLAQYLHDDAYLYNHPFIDFDTLWHKEQYVIFAVLDVSPKPSDSRFFNYFTHDTFSSDAEFSMYIRQLQLRSRYAIPIDVQPSDALLTLSTCLDEDRLVIVARRLREGETRSELRTLIRMATRQ